ncbi:Phosphatidylinositol 4-phosphate 5-kinase 8 isoform D [Glycine soja]|uniref:Phosphatidylinositol 4-phosphate 5-kinase 8 isoform D n=1 Tax=Glycine soja TaxID=3848 RepID=A0A445LAF2_GLYSO|nr:Phosphatidylinositol 4-phosphate 5-kinase 8 isoform D [Glycine soja]
MHQKKSEVQIGKESSGVSSDFNHHPLPILTPNPNQDALQSLTSTAPYKRPSLTTQPHLSKSPTLHKFPTLKPRHVTTTTAAATTTVLSLLRRRLRHRLRLFLFLLLPFFYFLVSHPTNSFLLDFLSAFSFSAALLFSLNLALPRIPSLRLFLNLKPKARSGLKLPIFWTVGARPGPAQAQPQPAGLRLSVVPYANGDVYEGELKGGKCCGSGVYYYSMSGRYEGDWVDGKYDGFGVETWARGSRYRGQYRQGLRHGFGVYRFYTGDVYAGEWLSGQSHGCGVHTCDDGSRYVGEFKWGVKHGLGHYHFRYGLREKWRYICWRILCG